jgi:hypothetical protein
MCGGSSWAECKLLAVFWVQCKIKDQGSFTTCANAQIGQPLASRQLERCKAQRSSITDANKDLQDLAEDIVYSVTTVDYEAKAALLDHKRGAMIGFCNVPC